MNTLLTILAISVLGPVIGSLVGIIKLPSKKFMFNMLAFAGGVILAISFLELIPESISFSSTGIAILGISFGALIMFFADKIIPHIHPGIFSKEQGCNLKKTATYLLIGTFIHNFPEGMAIAIGYLSDPKLGIVIALALAVHNIPESISTSAPYFHCTKKRLISFLISSSTVIPILIGFFVANSIYKFISPSLIGFIIGITAGLMIYITADEIIPSSSFKTSKYITIFSLILGILFVMILGLI